MYLCSPIREASRRNNNMVVVAQLVRALVCGTRGRGFESHLPPPFKEKPDDESHPVFLCPDLPRMLACQRESGDGNTFFISGVAMWTILE